MAQQTRRPKKQIEKQDQDQDQNQDQDILGAITPTLQEAKRYLENNPVQAAAIGAAVGALLMTLVSTEKGRSLARAAYDYANPMIAKYAREYVSQIAGNATESAISSSTIN